MNTSEICKAIQRAETYHYFGKIEKVVGMMIESVGRNAVLGICVRYLIRMQIVSF
jgi:hypothetical protein